MSQIDMIQAGIQMDAAKELGKIVSAWIQDVVRRVRDLRSPRTTPPARQHIPAAKDVVASRFRRQLQEG